MDEFLREIHTLIFKQWVLLRKDEKIKMTVEPNNDNIIYLTTDHGKAIMTFNKYNIIELQVINTYNQDVEFYLHFQMKTLKHALELYGEMLECLKRLVDRPILKILLSCSGGMTTSFFATKMNEAAKLLYLDYQVDAIGYNGLFDIGENYDVILLAPQISYLYAKVQEILSDQVVLKIPPQVFAKYNVGKLLNIIKKSLEEKRKNTQKKNTITIQTDIQTEQKILSLAIIRNSDRVHIDYRLYGPHHQIILNNEIIKPKMNLQDFFDTIDTVLIQEPDIAIIGITLPGIINDGIISSSSIGGLVDIHIEDFKSRYSQKIIFSNDVNSAAVGYYASQDKYQTISILFQPKLYYAGIGHIINGKLLKGRSNIAGEVQYFPLDLSDDKLVLNKTPEGALELVSKIILCLISTIDPEVIVLFCTMIPQVNDLRKELKKYLPAQYIPEIIKADDLHEYCLLGQMILCAQSL